MTSVTEEDFDNAVKTVLENLSGVDSLYPAQMEVLRSLVIDTDNLFVTAPTNSGKTLPPVMLPQVLKELNKLGYQFPTVPRVLFLTALNSIQLSLLTSLASLGIDCAALTRENVDQILSSEVPILLIGPETFKLPSVSKSLLKHRASFVLKVVDEAHLGMYIISYFSVMFGKLTI